ncbi:MAG: hypothetical protein R6T98_08090, partial [Desulfatiglandales bacterium]
APKKYMPITVPMEFILDLGSSKTSPIKDMVTGKIAAPKYSIGAATFQKLCPWKSGLEIKSGPGARDLNRSRYSSHHISGL